jgi:hypothetical protein
LGVYTLLEDEDEGEHRQSVATKLQASHLHRL